MEEREFTLSTVVTKVYEIEVKIMATSDEHARAQFEELRAGYAGDVTEDDLIEVVVEEDGCFDPIPDND
jgi:hypothetical protein